MDSIKRVLSKIKVTRSKKQFGDWGEFAKHDEVVNFIDHLSK